jgi:hypothetical protein
MDITITNLDIIHRPGFYLKLNVSKFGFSLLLQVEPTDMGPVYVSGLALYIGPIRLYFT